MGKRVAKKPPIEEDMLLVADNTHEIVVEKLEKYKAELAAMEKKKQKVVEDMDKTKEEEDEAPMSEEVSKTKKREQPRS